MAEKTLPRANEHTFAQIISSMGSGVARYMGAQGQDRIWAPPFPSIVFQQNKNLTWVWDGSHFENKTSKSYLSEEEGAFGRRKMVTILQFYLLYR